MSDIPLRPDEDDSFSLWVTHDRLHAIRIVHASRADAYRELLRDRKNIEIVKYVESSRHRLHVRVGDALDAFEAVLQDDEVDLSDVDTPEKAKAAQLELIAHLRDQLADVLAWEEDQEP